MATIADGTGRRIATHEAQIRTAAVEVKVLTISGKQVTLSVFRQLQDESLIDEATAQLRGVPWGHVNYFWGECKPDHLHVVWQQGEELRRACVWPEPPANPWQREVQTAQVAAHEWELLLDDGLTVGSVYSVGRAEMARVLVRARTQIPSWRREGASELYRHGEWWHSYAVAIPAYGQAWFVWCQRPASERQGWQAQSAKEARAEALDSLEHKWGSLATLRADIDTYERLYSVLRQRWAQQYDALAALDQLFIAV